MQNLKSNSVIIRLNCPINNQTINSLMTTIDNKMREGTRDFVLLISSHGGDTAAGLTVYNYLKGLPIKITTCNIGTVSSIAIVLYCIGNKRVSVPHAKFLIHEPWWAFQESKLDEYEIDEILKRLTIYKQNIAKVIATNTGKSILEVLEAMHHRTVFTSDEAQSWGLTHEINSELFEAQSEVFSID
ncbi:MAG TPA: ATP-dependent Clp protease proteolytic subunit [Candidatus Nitrosotalea sp.]|nr:ATP-dependent Clp protease proteolytic subunit [Candidatus Nitrosotalea sp.]